MSTAKINSNQYSYCAECDIFYSKEITKTFNKKVAEIKHSKYPTMPMLFAACPLCTTNDLLESAVSLITTLQKRR